PVPKYYPKMSPSQFLEWERKQEYKHEYVNGEVFAMSGASYNHNNIASNIIGSIWNYLKGKSCNIFGSDLRISVKWRDSYFYPDAIIVCDEPEFDDEKIKDTLKNPAVIFEILSSSTEDYDIGRKQMYYMQIESLQQYIIIDSQKMHVRVITKREEERTWKFDEFSNTEDKIFIEPIQFEITVGDLYKGVKL
ncbi:MAG: Uma2 family endonuclease, partial [Parafilimonas sp.]